MSMRISEIIEALQAAKEAHGDLPTFLFDSDIAKVDVHPCQEGGSQKFENGKRTSPVVEFVIEFHPA